MEYENGAGDAHGTDALADRLAIEAGRGFTVRAELLAEFAPQFEGALALYDFAQANRPDGAHTDDVGGHVALWSYARGTKTFGGSIRLAAAGFGEQAGMLNRSLFEDMALAHWAVANPARSRAHPEARRLSPWPVRASDREALELCIR